MSAELATNDIFTSLMGQAITVGLATTRIAVAFLILPLFSNQLIPALVRNAIFVALAVVTIVIQHETTGEISESMWIGLFLKEVVVGLAIGFLFGIYLWAFETAGMIIDTQVGISQAQILDPISGHETTLFGEFLGRLANYVFLAAGGLMLLVGVIFESYVLWPIDQPLPGFNIYAVNLFESEFGNYFRLTLLIASPILVLVFLIDTLMGLLNRYAQQFNVSFLSMPLKILASMTVLISMLFMLADLVVSELIQHAGIFPEALQQIFK